MEAVWRIRMLGGLVAEGSDREISRFRTQKTGALLAYLAYPPPGRSHPRDALIEILWPEEELDSARLKLRLALNSLRRQLEPPGVPAGAIIASDRHSVRLNGCATDVAEFEVAIQAARSAGSGFEREHLLARAVELYGGDLLLGHEEIWIFQERERLHGCYLQALDQLVALLQEGGHRRRALDYAHRAVAADPLREESHLTLIRLLAAAGEQTAAGRQYQELERLLREELNVAPSTAARQLIEKLPSASDAARTTGSPSPAAVSADPPTGAPVGTITFLLTDIEGSTALWEQEGEPFREALAIHHALLRGQFRRHGGSELREAGDSFLVAFAESPELQETAWTPPSPLPRGRLYQWQVTAVKEGRPVVSPGPDAPEARFRS